MLIVKTPTRTYRPYNGPTPPPSIGPFKRDSIFIIAREERNSAGTEHYGSLGKWGYRFLHVRPRNHQEFDLKKIVCRTSRGESAPVTSLHFAGTRASGVRWELDQGEGYLGVDYSVQNGHHWGEVGGVRRLVAASMGGRITHPVC